MIRAAIPTTIDSPGGALLVQWAGYESIDSPGGMSAWYDAGQR